MQKSAGLVRAVYVWATLSLAFLGVLWYEWPAVFNIVTFGFRDLGSFLVVDALISQHLRPAIDFGYIYGLLPIFAQHIPESLFGRRPEVVMGMGIAYLLFSSWLWTMIWRRFGASLEFWAAILLFSPLLVMFVPPPAHLLNQLSLMFTLLFLLDGRLALALTTAAIGALSMPSLPLVAVALVSFWIVVLWLRQPVHRFPDLVRQFVPGAVVYLALAVVLGARFGFASLFQTVLPFNGGALYKSLGWGILGQGLLALHPAGARITYYLGTNVGWWLTFTIVLAVVAIRSAWTALIRGDLNFKHIFVISCFALHLAFILFAFGDGFQMVYYYPILIGGVLGGLWEQARRALRNVVLVLLVGLSLLGQFTAQRDYWRARSSYQVFPSTAPLYASPAFASEWSRIRTLGAGKKLLVLSWGNGVGLYFPGIKTPDSMFMLPVYVTDRVKTKLLDDLKHADVVAEERGEDTRLIDRDPDYQNALAQFPQTETGANFTVWRR